MSTPGPQDRYVNVGGINTRYWAMGDHGTSVILVHGLGGCVEDWRLNVNALAEYHRVYALDLVGAGRTGKAVGSYSLPYGAQFLNGFLEALHVDRATLVGNSMGGAVTLQFAVQFPHRVQKLVLVNSAGLGRELISHLRLATLPLLGEWLARPRRRGAAQVFKACVYDPALVTDELVEVYYELAALPGAQECLLSALRAGANLRGTRASIVQSILDKLATIAAPTLIVWGQQDRVLPVAHAYEAEKRLPNARLHVFDPCGHLPQLERAEEFNALVLEFLGGSP